MLPHDLGARLVTDADQWTLGGARVNGSRWLIVGDSNSILGTSGIQGQSYTTFAPGLTGRLHEVARIATSGERSDQQLARVRAQIAAGVRPTFATCMVGTNDLNQSIPLEDWQANVTAITQELRAIGCETMLFTLPPRSGPANPKPPSVVNDTWNAWLRTYAATNGFLLFDLWKVVADPATGEFRQGWVDPADGVHLNGVASRAVGYELARQLGPMLAPIPTQRPVSLLDGNLLKDGIFTTDTMPSTWTVAGDGWTMEEDVTAPGGYVARLTSDVNPATRPEISQRAFVADGGFAPGDTVAAAVTFRIRDAVDVPAGSGMRAVVIDEGGTPLTQATWCFGQNLPTYAPMTSRIQWTVDPDRTSIRLLVQYIKPSSSTARITFDVHGVGIWNVTPASP